MGFMEVALFDIDIVMQFHKTYHFCLTVCIVLVQERETVDAFCNVFC